MKLLLERRPEPSRLALALAPVAAILFTLAVCALVVGRRAVGAPMRCVRGRRLALRAVRDPDPRHAADADRPGLRGGLPRALYNIGAEGQLYLGALAAVAVGGLHDGTGFGLPVPMLFAGMMLAAALAGALLLIPALLKTRLGVDEVVTTLLGNFIVLLFVSMMLDGPMKDPMAMGWPQSVALNGDLELGKLIERTRAHTGLLWAAGLALGLWLLNRYTVFGFQMRAVGANAHASRFLGLPVSRVMLGTAMLSARWPGWPAPSRWRAAPATSRWTCRRATATRAWWSPCWPACIRWA